MYAKGTASEQDVELAAVRFVCELFARNRHLSEGPVSLEAPQATLDTIRSQGVPTQGRPLDDVVAEMEHDVIGYGHNIDHARFLGFVPGPTSAISWLGDMMAAGYNRHAGSFSNYPAGCMAEDVLLEWFAGKAGFPAGTAGGIFVSGGSMANLTALTAARDHVLAPQDWGRATVYLSEQTHSSVAKGLHIIGVAPDRIRLVPCDDAWRMDVAALEHAIEQDEAAGLKPFAVVATGGTTNTGSVDPLHAIAGICRAHGLRMHVDGAFGASALLTSHRDLLDGVELADSLSWDAHKWLFQTYSCGMLLVRDRRTLLESFSVHPEYLRDLEGDQLTNPWDLGPELTRPARGLKLWFTLQVMGSDALSAAVEHGFDLARWAEDEVRRTPNAQVVSPAQMAMVNFRFAPARIADEAALDELNRRISRRIVASGEAGVFTTELNGHTCLRICALHPEATEQDMRAVVRRLGELCREEEALMAAPGTEAVA